MSKRPPKNPFDFGAYEENSNQPTASIEPHAEEELLPSFDEHNPKTKVRLSELDNDSQNGQDSDKGLNKYPGNTHGADMSSSDTSTSEHRYRFCVPKFLGSRVVIQDDLHPVDGKDMGSVYKVLEIAVPEEIEGLISQIKGYKLKGRQAETGDKIIKMLTGLNEDLEAIREVSLKLLGSGTITRGEDIAVGIKETADAPLVDLMRASNLTQAQRDTLNDVRKALKQSRFNIRDASADTARVLGTCRKHHHAAFEMLIKELPGKLKLLAMLMDRVPPLATTQKINDLRDKERTARHTGNEEEALKIEKRIQTLEPLLELQGHRVQAQKALIKTSELHVEIVKPTRVAKAKEKAASTLETIQAQKEEARVQRERAEALRMQTETLESQLSELQLATGNAESQANQTEQEAGQRERSLRRKLRKDGISWTSLNNETGRG